MVIYGVALLSVCTLLGTLVGEGLGELLGIHADIGGVGFAMIALIAARAALKARGWLGVGVTGGVGFWSAKYIPIIVAMAAQQDVVAAIGSGPVVVASSAIAFVLCLGVAAALARIGTGGAAPDTAAMETTTMEAAAMKTAAPRAIAR